MCPPKRLLDPFSQAFLERHAGARVQSAEARAELVAIASVVRLDISSDEVGHICMRRRLVAAGSNTHAPKLTTVSATWVAGEVRRRTPRLWEGRRCS